jgi:putative DNA-invertase from lambdoid prophage Rac
MHGYQFYADRSVSGGELNRPQLSQAIDALNDGDVLIVDRPDRLARDMLVYITICHQVAQRGATVVFADGSPPDTTPEGKLFQMILAAFAAYERDRIRARTRNGLRRKREQGIHLGKCPIGFKRDPETKALVADAHEQSAIGYILDRCRVKYNVDAVTAALNEVHGPLRGRPWTARTVRKVIARECHMTGN